MKFFLNGIIQYYHHNKYKEFQLIFEQCLK
jgi:hypothetical protein